MRIALPVFVALPDGRVEQASVEVKARQGKVMMSYDEIPVVQSPSFLVSHHRQPPKAFSTDGLGSRRGGPGIAIGDRNAIMLPARSTRQFHEERGKSCFVRRGPRHERGGP